MQKPRERASLSHRERGRWATLVALCCSKRDLRHGECASGLTPLVSRSAGRCVLPRVSPPGLAARTSGPRSRWTPTPFLPERPPDSRDPAALAPPRSALPPRVASARGGAVPRPHDSPRAGVRAAHRPALASRAESSRAAPAASRPPAGLGSEPHRPSPRLCFRSPGEKQLRKLIRPHSRPP